MSAPGRCSRLTLAVPQSEKGFRLAPAVCSYGYFLLAPNRWEPGDEALHRPLRLSTGRSVATRTTQPRPGGPLRVDVRPRLTPPEIAEVKAKLARTLRLDEDLRGWHKVRPAQAKRERFDRMFRSPTLFEDMVKTITGCNVSWGNTITMNRLLCAHYGEAAGVEKDGNDEPAFPTPEALARAKPDRLNRLTKVGYRADRIIRLAHGFVADELLPGKPPAWFEDTARTSDEVYHALLELHGFGPYAAANVAMLLGHYDRLAIDTETYRHFEQVHGLPRGSTPQKNHDRIERHYAAFAPYQFLAYWFELWHHYQLVVGDAKSWDRDEHAPNFTAVTLRKR